MKISTKIYLTLSRFSLSIVSKAYYGLIWHSILHKHFAKKQKFDGRIFSLWLFLWAISWQHGSHLQNALFYWHHRKRLCVQNLKSMTCSWCTSKLLWLTNRKVKPIYPSFQQLESKFLGISDFKGQLDVIHGQVVSLQGEEHGGPVGQADGQVLAVLARSRDDSLCQR